MNYDRYRMKQLFKSTEDGDRTGELGSIRPESELTDSEQLSQISRFEGYVQIEGWERIDATNEVKVKIRFPDGTTGREFFDWPSDSFSDSEFGRFVRQMGYTAETVDMINETKELSPYSDEELELESSDIESHVLHHKLEGLFILCIFPIFWLFSFLDMFSGNYWGFDDRLAHAVAIWSGFCASVWTAGIMWLIFL